MEQKFAQKVSKRQIFLYTSQHVFIPDRTNGHIHELPTSVFMFSQNSV